MEVTEPQNWPADPEQLRQLDRALRCNICQEFFQGPVVLACGHPCEFHCLTQQRLCQQDHSMLTCISHSAVCSQCIRRNLDYKMQQCQPTTCPECRAPCNSGDLRPDLALRSACTAWAACRQLLLEAVCGEAFAAIADAAEQPAQEAPDGGWQQHKQQRVLVKRRRNVAAAAAASRAMHPRARSVPAAPRLARQRSQQLQATGAAAPARALVTISSSSQSGSDAAPEDGDESYQESLDAAKQQEADSGAADSGAGSTQDDPAQGDAVGTEQQLKGRVMVSDSEDGDLEVVEVPPHKRRRSDGQVGPSAVAVASKENHVQHVQAQQQQQQQRGQLQRASGGSSIQPPVREDCVLCPICSVTVRSAFINAHLDTCLSKGGVGGSSAGASGSNSRSGAAAAPGAVYVAATAALPPKQGQANSDADGAFAAISGTRRQHNVKGRSVNAAPAAALDIPPKLCFNLLKDKDIKKKVQELGLCVEGNKAELCERYTRFRSYVLALADAGKVVTRASAAAAFNKEQRRIAIAAAHGGVSGPSGAAAVAGGGAPAERSSTGGGVTDGGLGQGRAAAGVVLDGTANSFDLLIQQTRETDRARKLQQAFQQQQQQQQPLSENEAQQQQQQQQAKQRPKQPLAKPLQNDAGPLQGMQQLAGQDGPGSRPIARLHAECDEEASGAGHGRQSTADGGDSLSNGCLPLGQLRPLLPSSRSAAALQCSSTAGAAISQLQAAADQPPPAV